MAIDALKLEAQQALDELLNEQLIPFKLKAEKVVAEDSGRYTVRFYDSRIHSIAFTLETGQCFKDVVRNATLARVERMSGALNRRKPK